MKSLLLPEKKITISESYSLRKKLDNFYENVTDYIAFNSISNQENCWVEIEESIKKKKAILGDNLKIKILEVGAGQSGFGLYLTKKKLRNNVEWHAQDVTKQNAAWLESQADLVFYNDVNQMESENEFDIIFSTFVLEHVTNPSIHLDILYKLLKTSGNLFIFCPRYDFPGYLCPSSRHLNTSKRVLLIIQWSIERLNSFFFRKPAFLIQTDLAAFHLPFFRDADAVHWVSLLDLKLWAKSKNAYFSKLKIGNPKPWSKDWIVKRWLICAIKIIR